MRTESKLAASIVYLGFVVFTIGTLLPKVEGSLLSYDVFVAIAFLIISFAPLEFSESWELGRILGWMGVISAASWLMREIYHTANTFSWINPIIGAITLLLLIIQFKNRNK